jgi:anti-sigma B factor antagonist
MSSQPLPQLLEVTTVGDATVVKVLSPTLDEATSQAVGDQLLRLADALAQSVLYLDLSLVTFLTSTALEKLIILNKKVRAAGGRLRLCGLLKPIYEVFQATRLTQVFDVCQDAPAPGTALPKRA